MKSYGPSLKKTKKEIAIKLFSEKTDFQREASITIPVINVVLSQLDDELNKEVNHIFDLRTEIPTRLRFYVDPTGRQFLSIVIHHIAFDGWSFDLFSKRVRLFYAFHSNYHKTPGGT